MKDVLEDSGNRCPARCDCYQHPASSTSPEEGTYRVTALALTTRGGAGAHIRTESALVDTGKKRTAWLALTLGTL